MPDPVPLPISVPLKRSGSTAGLGEKPHRPAKRRAPKACQSCRARKVRCNVTESGPPCTNCRLDEVDCTVTESKRKRRCFPKIEDDDIGTPSTLKASRSGRCQAAGNIAGSVPKAPTWPTCNLGTTDLGEHVPHSLYRFHSALISRKESSSRPPPIWPRAPFTTQERISTASDISCSASSRHWKLSASSSLVTPALPSYIGPVPPHLGSDDLAFLHNKTALLVPDNPLRDMILQSYIEFVHPFTPILDLKGFLAMIYNNDGSQVGSSLLLFQAIMFAGSAHVDELFFEQAGYHSRKDARRKFFHKARLLYDFDYEDDPVIQVQALLLMSSWYDSPNEKKDGWHWMGIAITTAYSIGLNRDPAHSNMELQQQRQRKRIWWSLVILDRLIGLALRRPARIMLNECDVPSLVLDDFETFHFSSNNTFIGSDCGAITDLAMQQSLAEMCVEMIKLCFCVSKVISTQYSLRDAENVTGTFDRGLCTVEGCHNDLEEWYNQLTDAARFDNPCTQSVKRSDAPIVVHRSLLHMVYFATLSALHRPQLLRTESRSSDPVVFETSRLHVDRAAAGTSDIAKCLLDRKFVGFLPTIGVTVLSPLITGNVDGTEDRDTEEQGNRITKLGHCVEAMKQMQDVNVTDIENPIIGSSVTNLFHEATRLNGIVPPTVSQTITPPPDAHSADIQIQGPLNGADMEKLAGFLASTPPESDASLDVDPDVDGASFSRPLGVALERDFESFVNLDEDLDNEACDSTEVKGPQEVLTERPTVAKYEQFSDDGLCGMEGLQMYEVEVVA